MNYTQKERFIDKICGVGLMFIFVELGYQMVVSMYKDPIYNLNNITKWVYIISGIFLAFAIGLIVYAYLKKSGSKACYGIELFAFAISIALLPGCYLYFTYPFTLLRIVFPILFFLYYIGKVIYVVRHRNEVVKNPNKKKG